MKKTTRWWCVLVLVMLVMLVMFVMFVMSIVKMNVLQENHQLVNERCPAKHYLLQANVFDGISTVTAAPPVRRPMCIQLEDEKEQEMHKKQMAMMLPHECVSVYRTE